MMKTVTAMIIGTSLLSQASFAGTINFDDATPGTLPPGWTATKTGKGEAKWTIEKNDTAPSKPNVLKQSGVATYPVCLTDDSHIRDGFVEAKFKTLSGKEDQAGGLAWRAVCGSACLSSIAAREQQHRGPALRSSGHALLSAPCKTISDTLPGAFPFCF
jgi:hypothetical protein